MIAVAGLDAFAPPALSALLVHLARASVAGGLFVAAVWVLTRALPRLPPALRCGLWWAAGLKLVLALVWTAPFELALLPPPGLGADADAVVMAWPGAPAEAAPGHDPDRLEAAAAGALPPAAAAPTLPWRGVLAGLWLLGVALGALGLVRELRAARRFRSESWPVTEPSLETQLETLRRRLGVRPRVELRLSDRAPGPLTLGLLRPAVVLPERDLALLSREELEMALAHELLHVRRLDLWAGWIPQLARRLFFFHPLAALAAREYRVAREAACDAAVLRELGAPPRSYGRLLLHWSRNRTARAQLAGIAAAGASSSFLDLKRRLEMLHEPTPASWRLKTAGGALAGLALAALIPLRIVAQPPTPPTPPSTTTASWTSTDDDGEAWALIEGGGKSNVWMSGSSGDMRRIDALRARDGGPLLWFRHDGREYVVRDAATLERARAILEPQMQLGRQQGELGSKQGELGAQQGELGARQGELGAQQGALGAQQAKLAAQMAALAADQASLHARRMAAGRDDDEGFETEEAEIERRMEPLEDRMEELSRQQEQLGEKQEALGSQQEALGSKQEALGETQEALGRRQEEAARKAQAQLRELAERAVAEGLAEPVE